MNTLPYPAAQGALERARTALSALQDSGRETIKLAGAIEAFTSQRLARVR